MYCRRCNYDLRGQEEARCPECGRAFDFDDPQTSYDSRGGNITRLFLRACELGRCHWSRPCVGLCTYFLVLSTLALQGGCLTHWYHDGVRFRDNLFAKANLQHLLVCWAVLRADTGLMEFDRGAVDRFCDPSSTLREFRIRYSLGKCARGLRRFTVPLAGFCRLATVLFWNFKRRRWVYGIVTTLLALTHMTIVALDRQPERIWPQGYGYIDDYVFVENLKPADQYRPSAIVAYRRKPVFQDVHLVGTMDGRVTYVRANGVDQMAETLRAILKRGTQSEPRSSGGGHTSSRGDAGP